MKAEKPEIIVMAKRIIETGVIYHLCEALGYSIDDAIVKWHSSNTYRMFCDDRYGIAREGDAAMVERLGTEWGIDIFNNG